MEPRTGEHAGQRLDHIDQHLERFEQTLQRRGEVLQQVQQTLNKMRRTQQRMQKSLQQRGQILQAMNARLPAVDGAGAPSQAMSIVAARERNARSSRWVPVPNNAGNTPNPAPTSRVHVNAMTARQLDLLLQHYGVRAAGTRSAKQQALIALIAKR